MAEPEGQTKFGTPQTRGIVGAGASTRNANSPGILMLETLVAGVLTPNYLWVDASGTLRISQTIPTDQDNDGTVVGTQT